MNNEEKSYRDFFKEELYDGFVDYLIDKLGHAKVIAILRNRPLVSKKGIHPDFRLHFNVFMNKNPIILKRFIKEEQKFMGMRNIAGGELQFPIDTSDKNLMLKENLRRPHVIPTSFSNVSRASKEQKNVTQTFLNQRMGGTKKEYKYLIPKRLTVHFKNGFAEKIGKTTESFMVESRSDAMNIILDRFEKKVAYATIQNEEEFVFVKPRNGKTKRSRKLHGKI